MYNNYGFNNAAMMGMGVTYDASKQITMTNPLGERARELMKNGNGQPKLQILQADMDKAICTHRLDNKTALYDIGGGKVRCQICGCEFEPQETVTKEAIEECAKDMHDLLNTAKVMWLDMPEKVGTELFQVLAVVDKVPELYAISKERYDKYTSASVLTQNDGNMNGFNLYNGILGGGMMPGYGMPMMGMPMMGQPMAAPMGYDPNMAAYGQTPMQQAMVQGAGQGLVNNGFGFTQLQPTAAPVAAPAAQAPAPAAQPAATTDAPVQIQAALHV